MVVNVKDYFENIGKKVSLIGIFELYFSNLGLKLVIVYKF